MHKSNGSKEFTFKIEPDEQGGATKTVTLNRHNIAEPPQPGKGRKKKKAPKAHLLIGFDTEYQAIADSELQSTIEAGAKNELLSYQFSIKLFAEDASDGHPETEGIIIPAQDQRLTMAEFIGFAIGSLIETYPDIQLPTNVYLIGHFLRADLPAFSDFKDSAKLTSNVRSTFVSIDSAIKVPFNQGDDRIAEFDVRVRDTFLLAPAGAKSLAGLGQIVGFEKIQLGSSEDEDKAFKQNMAKFRKERWSEFREYGIRDAQICVRFAERVIEQSNALFGSFKMPATLTSFGTKLLIQGWKQQNIDPNDVLGREEVKQKRFSKKRGHYMNETAYPLREEAYYQQDFVTDTYHGGRNEQFMFGIADECQWRDHDLSSAYTTAMSLIGFADWENICQLDKFEDISPLDLAFFSVDFEFPKTVRFPTLPVRTSNGIIFPRKGNSKCAAPELFLAMQLGAKLRFRRGILVPADRERRVFREFIQTSIRRRSEHPKGSFDNLFWKEVGNSTYGKTAQGLREKRVYDLQSDDMKALPPSKITQPYFASFITSYTRAVLGEILNRFSTAVQVFSVTTDGFLSNANDAEIAEATTGPLFNSFASARRELDQSGIPLEVKHTVRQPVGWRTRGSATLKPGQGENGLVLQKGGLKTNAYDDLPEENREVLDLFLNRTPDRKIKYRSAVGIKDMLRGDMDYVFKSVEKRLSMEFDWKRTPINIREEPFELEGQHRSHLTFDTAPINDVATFNHVRDVWDKYNKKPYRNLKTVKDFENFEIFRLTNTSPDREAALYLSRTDGDLKRLRRDLTRAYQKHQAGFDVIRDRTRMKHADFCSALTECGIPCEISDIDNAKRAEFKPHQTHRTPRVVQALEMLKSRFYPELETELFFPEGTMEKLPKSSEKLAA